MKYGFFPLKKMKISVLFAAIFFSLACIITGSVSTVYAKSKEPVVIGQATIGEKGKMYGTKPGDQSGYEVSTMNFTYRKGGWSGWTLVARAKDAAAAKKIAKAMKQACENDKIGYGKDGRQLYDEAQTVDFDLSKIKKKVNCDCYSLTATCAAAAGLNISPFYLEDSDTFKTFTSNAYCTKPNKLQPGDILVTLNRKHSHVAVVVSSPNKAKGGDPNPKSSYKKGVKYRLLTDQYTHIGAGSDYFYYEYDNLSASGRKIAVIDEFEEGYTEIKAGMVVKCLEARRNWIRTSAGWIKGDEDGTACITPA